MKTNDLYGLVLCGGKSRRMNKDKALLVYDTQPQVEVAFKLLSQFCAKVFVSNQRESAEKAPFNQFPQIFDHERYAAQGPLSGIISAMKEYPGVAWFVLACDLPFVTEETLGALIKRRDASKMATVFLSHHDGLPEPLCAIYEPHALHDLDEFFKYDMMCPRKILMNSAVKFVELQDSKWLDNINTPSEFQKAKRVLAQG